MKMNDTLNPGVGYRLLKAGEIIQQGDEFSIRGDNWEIRNTEIGKPFDPIRGQFIKIGDHYPTRRAVEPPSVNPGPGYRLLKIGEIREPGDQVLNGVNWVEVYYIGEPVSKASGTCRRKIESPFVDPGPGYRLLQRGEILQPGDQWKDNRRAGGWHRTRNAGKPARFGKYRRKIESSEILGQLIAEQRAPEGKLFRLLVIGEIIMPGDEVYRLSEWRPATEGVVVKHDAPVRRAIFNFIGGPA